MPAPRASKGIRPTEIIGQHFSRFYTQEDQDTGLPARALEAAAREGRFENEGWRVRKDGSLFWASVVIDPIRGEDGALVGFSKVTRDLTERRSGDEALRRSEEQFRLLVQGVTDYAIYMLDPEGRVTSWNAGAERIKGYAPSEIIGEHFSRFYTPEDARECRASEGARHGAQRRQIREGGIRVRKDGRRFWAHVVIDPIRGDDGSLIGFAKITRDITERREGQIALEKAREALFSRRRWMPLVNSPAASRTTSTTCSWQSSAVSSLSASVSRMTRKSSVSWTTLFKAHNGAQR